VIPAPFDYVAADSAAHAIELLATYGDDAKVLAGGHSLLPMMKLRLAAPAVLIDIARADGLSGISVDGGELVIGATTPRWSATRRSGTAARSAARSPTRTRRPTCRWRWSRSAARSS
jgi:carbon-monoxide dehydrogenase medium subunit